MFVCICVAPPPPIFFSNLNWKGILLSILFSSTVPFPSYPLDIPPRKLIIPHGLDILSHRFDILSYRYNILMGNRQIYIPLCFSTGLYKVRFNLIFFPTSFF